MQHESSFCTSRRLKTGDYIDEDANCHREVDFVPACACQSELAQISLQRSFHALLLKPEAKFATVCINPREVLGKEDQSRSRIGILGSPSKGPGIHCGLIITLIWKCLKECLYMQYRCQEGTFRSFSKTICTPDQNKPERNLSTVTDLDRRSLTGGDIS